MKKAKKDDGECIGHIINNNLTSACTVVRQTQTSGASIANSHFVAVLSFCIFLPEAPCTLAILDILNYKLNFNILTDFTHWK